MFLYTFDNAVQLSARMDVTELVLFPHSFNEKLYQPFRIQLFPAYLIVSGLLTTRRSFEPVWQSRNCLCFRTAGLNFRSNARSLDRSLGRSIARDRMGDEEREARGEGGRSGG